MTEGWWKYAKPGNKVVCVRHVTRNNLGKIPKVVSVGDVFTIQALMEDPWFKCGVAIWFGHFDAEGREMWFGARLFRPLQTKSTETGMDILKAILHGAPVKEDA